VEFDAQASPDAHGFEWAWDKFRELWTQWNLGASASVQLLLLFCGSVRNWFSGISSLPSPTANPGALHMRGTERTERNPDGSWHRISETVPRLPQVERVVGGVALPAPPIFGEDIWKNVACIAVYSDSVWCITEGFEDDKAAVDRFVGDCCPNERSRKTRIVACLHRVCQQLGAKPKIPLRCIQGGASLQNIYEALLEDVRRFAGLSKDGTEFPSPQSMTGKSWDWYAGPKDKSVLLIGYAGNSDRYETWLTNAKPLRDSQQNVTGTPYASIQSGLPADPGRRDVNGGYWVTGQVEGSSAVHTASDIPVYAEGRGSNLFRGTMDNTDVFFLVMQAVVGGTPKTN
jgi:hypothetical protein